MAERSFGRGAGDLRPVHFDLGYTRYAEGSVLCSFGHTKVLCNASVEERQPPFLEGSEAGWVTAEYQLLPRSTHTRNAREARKGRQGGRTLEIQRLIGRSLRGVVDRQRLGPRTIIVDCDVLQADGGTRTASITGGFVALALAIYALLAEGKISADPIREAVAAVSCGIVDGRPALDLSYEEDHLASVDLNLVATESGGIVEIQGTSENEYVMSRGELDSLVDLACTGTAQLIALQKEALSSLGA